MFAVKNWEIFHTAYENEVKVISIDTLNKRFILDNLCVKIPIGTDFSNYSNIDNRIFEILLENLIKNNYQQIK